MGQIEGSGFWITANSNQYTMYVNSDDGYGTNCFIDAAETTNKRMNCFIDILEGDLYLYDIAIQYNAPPNLCDQVRIEPHWYWNHSPGTGPSAITVNVDTSSDNPTVTNCTSDGGLCSADPELTDVLNPSGPSCVYDRSGVGSQNCCFGEYDLTIVSNDGAGGITTTVTDSTWGGSVTNCIGGSAKNNWTVFNEAGYPRGLILPVPKTATGGTIGLNGAVELKSPAQFFGSRFSEYASFYEVAGDPHLHSGYVDPATSNRPYAVEPIDDLDGSYVPFGNDSFIFSCLDSGWEIKHQIRVYIREWNTAVDFLAYASSQGVTYNPHQQGIEGVNCDYASFPNDTSCNDFRDFTDILTDVGGTYILDNTNPSAAAIRRTYFPNVNYP